MAQLREYNKKLLYNILPDHVAQHFLLQSSKKNDVSVLLFLCSRNGCCLNLLLFSQSLSRLKP